MTAASFVSRMTRKFLSKDNLNELSNAGPVARKVAAALEAVKSNAFPVDRSEQMVKIEGLRRDMLASSEMLASWERPWLERSSELQEKLKLQASEDQWSTSITVAAACKASKPENPCRLLFALVTNLQPTTVVEMGTNVGISGAYIAAALESNGKGRLTTLEGSHSKVELARRNFDLLGLAQRVNVVAGDFAETLEPHAGQVAPIDLAFIDGFHDGPATLQYHALFKRLAAPDAVFIYDDIDWSPGMIEAWHEIQADGDVQTSIDLGPVGIVIASTGPGPRLSLQGSI